MRRSLIPILILLALSISSAQGFSDEINPRTPIQVISEDVLPQLLGIVVAFMFTLVSIAAVAYAAGQLFGAETRARASVFAHGILASVLVSGLIIVLLFFIMPNFLSGEAPPYTPDDSGFGELFLSLSRLARSILSGMIMLFVVLAALFYAISQIGDSQSRARSTTYANGLIVGALVSALVYLIFMEVIPMLVAPGLLGPVNLGSYESIIIHVASFMAIFIAGTYLASKLLRVPEWEAYLNIELSNLASSFLIILFVVGLVAASDAISTAYLISLGHYDSAMGITTPTKASIVYISNTVLPSLIEALYDMFSLQACTSVLNTFARRIGEQVLTQTYKVFPGIDTFVSITNVLAAGLMSAYGSLSAQLAFMYLIDSVMRAFILPAGLILRFIPATRDAGAFLIALSFGFTVIYPLSYLVNVSMFEEVVDSFYSRNTLLIYSTCGPFNYGIWGAALNPAANPIFSSALSSFAPKVGSFLAQVFNEATLGSASMAYFMPVMRQLSLMSLLVIFIPALSMVVTIAFINAMSKFIMLKM